MLRSPGLPAVCRQVTKLIEAIEALKAELEVPTTIREVMNKPGSHDIECAYKATTLDMAYQAFDDQCTGANPRYTVSKRLPLQQGRQHCTATKLHYKNVSLTPC